MRTINLTKQNFLMLILFLLKEGIWSDTGCDFASGMWVEREVRSSGAVVAPAKKEERCTITKTILLSIHIL
jgi:hypothetical protein